jgi:hypothetical protein
VGATGWSGLCDGVRSRAVFVFRACSQGHRLDAFQLKERELSLRQRLYGQSHPVVTEFAKELCLQYSVALMDLVRAGDKDASLQLLEKAQLVSSSPILFPDPVMRKQLLAVMYNNFGCYYKL